MPVVKGKRRELHLKHVNAHTHDTTEASRLPVTHVPSRGRARQAGPPAAERPSQKSRTTNHAPAGSVFAERPAGKPRPETATGDPDCRRETVLEAAGGPCRVVCAEVDRPFCAHRDPLTVTPWLPGPRGVWWSCGRLLLGHVCVRVSAGLGSSMFRKRLFSRDPDAPPGGVDRCRGRRVADRVWRLNPGS